MKSTPFSLPTRAARPRASDSARRTELIAAVLPRGAGFVRIEDSVTPGGGATGSSVRAGAIGPLRRKDAVPTSETSQAQMTRVSVDSARSTSPCHCDFHRGMTADQAWSTLP